MNQISVGSVDPPPGEAKPLWERRAAAEHGQESKSTQRLCDVVALATAAAFAVPVDEMIAASRRSAYVAFARQSAMYLAHVTFGLSYSEIARAFGRDRTTASHACQLVENRRDDPAMDALLGSLEDACRAIRRRLYASVQP
jgi:chromosomal replication initiation ATPase DnaA